MRNPIAILFGLIAFGAILCSVLAQPDIAVYPATLMDLEQERLQELEAINTRLDAIEQKVDRLIIERQAGDMNKDGVVNALDIPLFVDALTQTVRE